VAREADLSRVPMLPADHPADFCTGITEQREIVRPMSAKGAHSSAKWPSRPDGRLSAIVDT
jgi:hypothetical protein